MEEGHALTTDLKKVHFEALRHQNAKQSDERNNLEVVSKQDGVVNLAAAGIPHDSIGRQDASAAMEKREGGSKECHTETSAPSMVLSDGSADIVSMNDSRDLVALRTRLASGGSLISDMEATLSRLSLTPTNSIMSSMCSPSPSLGQNKTGTEYHDHDTLKWMETGRESRQIQEQGATMLYMLSKVSRLSDTFRVSELIKTLMAAMKKFPTSVPIHLYSVQLFHNLALEKQSNIPKMIGKEVMKALVFAMRSHPKSVGVQRGGCLFLEVLAADKRWHSYIQQAGGLRAARNAKEYHKSNATVVFPAEQVLTKAAVLPEPTRRGNAEQRKVFEEVNVGRSLGASSSIGLLDHSKPISFVNCWLRDIDGRWGRYTGSCIRQIASDNEYKPHGRGEMRYDDGYVFRGRWEYGKWKGEGQLAYPEGHVYNGNFQYKISSKGRNTAGRLFGVYARHGEGTIRYKDDQYYHSYKGSWNDGLPHGRGRMVYADKSVYEGYFVQGKRQGQGVYQQEDGTCYNGAWEDDTYHDYGILSLPVEEDQKPNKYEGFFVDGKFSGQGVRQWPDGRVYRGEWRDGKTDGRGRLEHPDGYVYHGSFQDDRIESVSRLVCPSGSVYSGEFVRVGDDDESTFEGIGEVKYDDGSVYRGSFVGWKPHGYGLFLDISGARCEGQWLHGTWDGQGTTFSSEDSENSESAQKPE